MLKQYDRELRALLLLTDTGLCAAVFVLAQSWSGGATFAVPQGLVGWRLLALGLVAALALPLTFRGLASEPSSRLQGLLSVTRELLLAAGMAGVIVAAVAFAIGAPIHPTTLLGCLVGQLFAVGALRLSILTGLQVLRRRGRNYRNIVVIGSGPRARELTETIARRPEWGLRVVAYVDEGDSPRDDAIPAERLFKMVDFPKLLHREVIDEVVTACPRSLLASIGPAVEACGAAGVPLTVMTDLFGDYLPPPKVKRFGSHATLSFRPVHHSRSLLRLKRGMDILGAVVGLLVAAPVLGAAALAIRLTSPGPVFFRQIRSGLYGRPFTLYKLRTMVADAEEQRRHYLHLNEMSGPVFKIRRDPRITPVGRFLRAFSIDEVPQLWNVLIGDMSLVGPRPPIPSEVALYRTTERRRLSMRPGLTCLWQVNGRNRLGFDDWVKLDLRYIDTWSLRNDLKILAMTVLVVLRGTGS